MRIWVEPCARTNCPNLGWTHFGKHGYFCLADSRWSFSVNLHSWSDRCFMVLSNDRLNRVRYLCRLFFPTLFRRVSVVFLNRVRYFCRLFFTTLFRRFVSSMSERNSDDTSVVFSYICRMMFRHFVERLFRKYVSRTFLTFVSPSLVNVRFFASQRSMLWLPNLSNSVFNKRTKLIFALGT